MANLIKIQHVQLYVGFTNANSVNEAFTCQLMLDSHEIPYATLMYPDSKNNQQLFDNLSSWVFDLDYRSYRFTSFPLIIWQEVYDNYDVIQCVVQNSTELAASRLVANKNLFQTQGTGT